MLGWVPLHIGVQNDTLVGAGDEEEVLDAILGVRKQELGDVNRDSELLTSGTSRRLPGRFARMRRGAWAR